MKKKLIISLIAVVLILALSVGVLAACNKKKNNGGDDGDHFVDLRVNFDSVIAAATGSSESSVTATMDYSLVNDEDHDGDEYYDFYTEQLGGYHAALVAAKANDDVDAKYAGMAIAEAKLLESAVLVPTSSQGGQYAIGRVAPGFGSTATWGSDSERVENLTITNEILKAVDRDALRTKYKELKGTGTYEAWARAYLRSKGYTFKDSYTIGYSSDAKTWDVTATYRAADTEKIVQTYDGLIQYDNEGRCMGMLADRLTISEDGLKYTFHIREGVKWVDKDGRAYADVKADDFVYGMYRICNKSALRALLFGIVKNAYEYCAGTIDDFAEVGVRAVDTYTVEYTLEQPTSYFISMFNYNPFAPVCREYAESTEGYGTSYDKILYCGPYLVSNFTPNNKIVFSANPAYWNKDNVKIKTYTWNSYAENKDVNKTYNDMKAGLLDGAGLNATTIELAKNQNMWEYVYVSGTNATTFSFFLNLDRQAYETIEGYEMESPKTAAQKALSKAALANENFRMAFARGLDRAAYNAQDVGEDCKLYSLQNSYTPGNFVQLGKAVTIAINGVNRTFPKGTYYGEIVQAQINADMGERAIKVWDPTQEYGAGSSSGFDGWYNANVAKAYLAEAIEELAAQGFNVSAQNPIYLDYPYWDYETYANRAVAFKQAMETLFEGKVIINLVATEDIYGWYYAGYYAEAGAECNYDLYDCSGWGPDYLDPQTYLNTMLPGDGDMTHCLGIY